jgi:hypothetical protein
VVYTDIDHWGCHVATAKLFQNGRSQAVRLPKEFRFEGDAVSVRREGEAVILEPLRSRAWPKGYWRRWGRATRQLDIVEPLPPGGDAVDLDG